MLKTLLAIGTGVFHGPAQAYLDPGFVPGEVADPPDAVKPSPVLVPDVEVHMTKVITAAQSSPIEKFATMSTPMIVQNSGFG